MGLLSFISGKNPAKQAMPYLNQIPGAVNPYYQPYIDQGQTAGASAAGQYDRLTNDPGNFLNEIMASYSPSRGFQALEERALKAARGTAAAGGFAGTENDQYNQAKIAKDLASEDMQDWVRNVLGLYGTGIAGQQHLGDQGYQASMGYGDILGNNLAAKAGLAFQGQQQKNQGTSDIIRSIIGAIGMGMGNPGGAKEFMGAMFGNNGQQPEMAARGVSDALFGLNRG